MTRISIRFNIDELKILKKVKEIMGIKDNWGADSQAIKGALDFYLANYEKPVRDFKYRYSNEEKKIIKKAIKSGVL